LADAAATGYHPAVNASRLRIVAALIFGLLGLGLFWGALVRGETFAHRDLGAFYRPAKAILVPLARASGGVPEWNPLFASGQPFASNPEFELFHPMTALLFLLPFEWAFRLQVILPPFFAAGAMYALLRGLRRTRPAALFGAVGWGFGGYLLSTSNLLPILFAVAVLPLVILFVVRLARAPRAIDLAGLAVSFGAIGLAGEPSTLLATPPLIAAAVLSVRRARVTRPLALAAGGVVLGAALAACMLLPGAHHAAKTRRAAGLATEVVNQWSMPPLRIAELVAPNLLGHIDERDAGRYWGRSFYPIREFPFLYSLYPGLLATLLAALAVRRRALWPWLALAAAGFLIATGSHLPVWGLLRRLPLLSGIRFPEKFALLVAFPVVVASAYGFDQVQGLARARRALLPALLVLLGIGLVTAFFAGRGAHVALRLAVVAAAAALLLRFWPGRARGALIVCAAAALDLGLAGKELVPSVPLARVAAPPSFLAPLTRDGRDHLLFHLAAWDPTLNEAPGLAKPPVPAQWGLAMALETDFDLTQLDWTLRGTELFWSAMERDTKLLGPMLRRRGVTDILRFRKGVTRQGGRLVSPDGPPLELLSSGDTQPFAFAARRVELVSGERGWVDAMVRLGGEAGDTTCVDRKDLVWAGQPSPAEVQIGARTPMSVPLQVTARGPGPSFIAVNQSWDEGWSLTINGAAAPLLRTDVSLSGFVVPPGRHQVLLEYRDPWLQRGMLVSLLAALICLGLVLAGRLRRR
jgi:hypothetical protein